MLTQRESQSGVGEQDMNYSNGNSQQAIHPIPMHEITSEFSRCWVEAAKHLERQTRAAGEQMCWLKCNLEPPFLEHLSFRVRNQLFFVRVEDIDRPAIGPGNLKGLESVAEGCEGHPCILRMRKAGDGWHPADEGWSLSHALTEMAVDPLSLGTDQPIEMTDWELHDFGVQMVRRYLVGQDREIMSSQGNPHVDPSLWFVGDEGPEWVVVRTTRYPEMEADRPEDWDRIALGCAVMSRRGKFASVSVASSEQQDPENDGVVLPLTRGGPLVVRFMGLQSDANEQGYKRAGRWGRVGTAVP